MHTRITQSIILLLTLLVVTECFASETIPPATEYRFIQSASASSSLEQLKTIRKLFDNREFEKLTNIFERRQKQFEQDPTNERPIVEAFLVFNNSRPADRHLLDEWVEAQPNHFASYLARAYHLYENAWNLTGEHSREAPLKENDNFIGKELFRLAYTDTKKALTLQPNLLPAHLHLLTIHNALCYDIGENQVIRSAKRLFPDSYLLYSTAIWAKLPQWGGSYSEIEALASEAYKQSQNNKEKTLVPGLMYAELAQNYYSKKNDPQKAAELFEKAFSYGENSKLYYARAQFHMHQKKHLQAISDLNKVSELYPGNPTFFYYRSQLYKKTGETAKAIADIKTAWEIWPEHPVLFTSYKWLREQREITPKLPQAEPASSIEIEEAFAVSPSERLAGLTWLNGRLYMGTVYENNIFYEIDPNSGSVLRKQSTPFRDTRYWPGLSNDGKDIYITIKSGAKSTARLESGLRLKGDIFKLQSSDKTIGDTAIHNGAIYAIGTSSLYDKDSYGLLRYSLDGTLLESFQHHQPTPRSYTYNTGMTSDGTNLWVTAGKKLLKIDPENGNVLRVYPIDIKRAESLAWDGEKLWTVSYSGMFYTIKIKK